MPSTAFELWRHPSVKRLVISFKVSLKPLNLASFFSPTTHWCHSALPDLVLLFPFLRSTLFDYRSPTKVWVCVVVAKRRRLHVRALLSLQEVLNYYPAKGDSRENCWAVSTHTPLIWEASLNCFFSVLIVSKCHIFQRGFLQSQITPLDVCWSEPDVCVLSVCNKGEGGKREQRGEIKFHSWSVISWAPHSVRRQSVAALSVKLHCLFGYTLLLLLFFLLFLFGALSHINSRAVVWSWAKKHEILPCVCPCLSNFQDGFSQPFKALYLKD